MCFGGKSSQQANTTINTDNSTRVGGSIGFTGAQGLQYARIMTNAGNTALSSILASGNESLRVSTAFNAMSVNRAYDTIDTLGSTVGNTLSDLVNAERDFSQRAIAAGTGQATPLQNLSAAGETTPIKPWMILAAAGTIIAVAFLNK